MQVRRVYTSLCKEREETSKEPEETNFIRVQFQKPPSPGGNTQITPGYKIQNQDVYRDMDDEPIRQTNRVYDN